MSQLDPKQMSDYCSVWRQDIVKSLYLYGEIVRTGILSRTCFGLDANQGKCALSLVGIYCRQCGVKQALISAGGSIMKLDAFKLGLATAIVLAAVWIICSILVLLVPGPMMQMGGHMLHAELDGYHWSMHWPGFLIGLILWSALSGLLVWAIAGFYNRLSDRGAD
jgi:hypothetical protein